MQTKAKFRLDVETEHRIVPAGVGCLKLIDSAGVVIAIATNPAPWTVTAGSDSIVVPAEDVVAAMAEEARKTLPDYPDNNLVAIAEIGENR